MGRMPNEPVDLAERKNEGKLKLSYLLENKEAMEGLAARFELGERKYSRGNYRKGFPYTKVIDSLLRHLLAFQNGEDIDPVDGGEHVDAIAWNAIILAQLAKTRPDLDDRYPDLRTQETPA